MSLAPHATVHDAAVRESPVLEWVATQPAPATRGAAWLELDLRHAGPRRVRIAWELHGAVGAPVIVVQGGISATRHVAAGAAHPEAGWWDAQVGAGRAIDTRRCRVLSIDWLGADGALDCTLDPADQADALAALLDTLHIATLRAFVGASYGAMVGLQFAARHGPRLARLVAISGAHRSHPQVTALRVIQRRIVALGRSEGGRREALALARSLAVIGYRSGEEFGARFAAAPRVDVRGARFAVEDYFDAIGPRFVARFTPTAYLRLSESIDLHWVSPANALAKKNHFRLLTIDYNAPSALAAALTAGPRLVWIETPSNPLLRLTDLRHVADAAHAAGARVVVDNTFLSPALQRPIALGADLVVHSTTKYINGHSDVVGGAVIAKEAALHEQLVWWANALGLTGSPFDAFLTLRGLRTLSARMRVHQQNAAELAERLHAHPAVARVFYPGLASHPQHALAARQQSGFGAMLSFELRGGEGEVRAFLDGLQCFTLAESLGGVESLIAHPATMTHAAMSAQARAVAGISDGLLRLSVGIEAIEDLALDLKAGLERALRHARGQRGAAVTA